MQLPTNNNQIYFMNDQVYQSEDVGGVGLLPLYYTYSKSKSPSVQVVSNQLKDIQIDNITNICNTFMIKILEDYVDKNEIAYMIDFTDKFNMREYLNGRFNVMNMIQYDLFSCASEIYSSIMFILCQFVQFYTTTKLVYSKEGVDLYKVLYKLAYNEDCKNDDLPLYTKYSFCVSILQEAIEYESEKLKECANRIAINIRNLYDKKNLPR